MSVYLATSVLVSLFVADIFTVRARSFLSTETPILLISDFAAVEFSSAMSRYVRIGRLSREEARAAFTNFDAWIARVAQRTAVTAPDIASADVYLRRLDLALRAPDAIHIAVAHRAGATLATFDEKMAASARTLQVEVEQMPS